MRNVIPGFISGAVHRNEEQRSGSFPAAALNVDIAGFTSITEYLMERGRQGAEDLSILINRIYEPLISAIYTRGGFVTTFGGDGVTSVFPGGSGRAAHSAAEEIRDMLSRRQRIFGRYSGGREIKARLGLAGGEICWRIYGGDMKAFFFHGRALEECSTVTRGMEAGRVSVSGSLSGFSAVCGESPVPLERVRPTIARMFYPEEVLRARPGGEFRNVVSVFVGLHPGEISGAGGTVSEILSKTCKYGGYFNGMFCDDKGPHMLIVFGAPVSYENNIRRALSLALDLRSEFNDRLRAGITYGTAFAGVVGSTRRCTYTVLGDCVNTAARLMQSAEWGGISLPENLRGSFAGELVTGSPRRLTVKGKSRSIEVADLLDVTDARRAGEFEGAFVGRRGEMEELMKGLAPLETGSFAGVTILHGEAGVGKSRLLAELTARFPEYRSFTMQTDGILRKGLGPFTHLLKEFFQQNNVPASGDGAAILNEGWDRLTAALEGLPDRKSAEPVLRELRRTRSMIAAMMGYLDEGSLHGRLDARGRFDNTILALKAFFKAQSLMAPTMFLLEDFQWIDNESLTALRSITRGVEDFPFAVLITSRANDDGTLILPDLHDTVPFHSMELYPLEEGNAMDLAAERLGGDLSGELFLFIMDRTQGNPFYIEQFCSYLTENGMIRRGDDGLRLRKEAMEVPESIGSIILARIDRLSGKLKEVVQTASVLGREFDVQVLSAMLRGDQGSLRSLLAEGERESIWSALNELLYIFSHTMLREVAYDMQLKTQLRQLHRLAGVSMEEFYGNQRSRFADIAYHYGKAMITGKAMEYLRKAADFARGEYRNQEAVDILRRMTLHQNGLEERMETEFEILELLVLMGKWTEAEEILERSRRESLENGLDNCYAHCCRHHAALENRRGRNEKARAHLKEAWEYYTLAGNETGLMKCRSVRANISMILGDFDEAEEDLKLSAEAAQARGDMNELAKNTSDLGTVYLYVYRLEEAEECLRRAWDICSETGNLRVAANVLNNLGVVEYNRTNYDGCRRYLREYMEIAEKVGDQESMTYVIGNIGVLHQEKGELDQAMSCYEKQLAMARELGITYTISFAARQIGLVHRDRGDFSQAREWLTESLRIARNSGDTRNASMTARELGDLCLKAGDLEGAREHLENAASLGAEIDKETHATTLLLLARLSSMEGRNGEALRHVEQLTALRREMGEELPLLGSLTESAGILLSAGHEGRAGELLKEAREMASGLDPGDLTRKLEFQESLHQALTDPAGAEARLEGLLNDHGLGDRYSAQICFHLHRITGKEEYRRSAIRLYRELHRRIPEEEFRKKLETLERSASAPHPPEVQGEEYAGGEGSQ